MQKTTSDLTSALDGYLDQLAEMRCRLQAITDCVANGAIRTLLDTVIEDIETIHDRLMAAVVLAETLEEDRQPVLNCGNCPVPEPVPEFDAGAPEGIGIVVPFPTPPPTPPPNPTTTQAETKSVSDEDLAFEEFLQHIFGGQIRRG